MAILLKFFISLFLMSNYQNAFDAVMQLIRYSSFILYDEKTWYSYCQIPNFVTFENDQICRNCEKWGEQLQGPDIDRLEKNGITRENIGKIRDLSIELTKKMFIKIEDKNDGSPIVKLGKIFYKDRIEDIKETMDQINELYEECESSLKDEYELVSHDLGGRNRASDLFVIINPYRLIENVAPLIQSFIDEIESDNENVPIKSFIFSKEFKLLSTFRDDLKDKNLSKDESRDLISFWTLMMVKGFALNQIKVKISEKEIMKIRNDRTQYMHVLVKGDTDEDVQLYSEKSALYKYGEKLFKNSSDLDEEKLNQIYQTHKDDEIGAILKPLIEELIPYYNSLITPEGFIKLTLKVTDTYYQFQIAYSKYAKEHYDGGKPLVGFYANFLPMKLVDPPGEKYQELVKHYLSNYLNWSNKELPELEEIDDLDSLENQKYYTVWYLISSTRSLNEYLSLQESSLIMALLNWKIEGDSEDARKLEQYFRNSIELNLKNFEFSNYGSNRHSLIQYCAKYIITKILPASEPLNPSELKKNLRKYKIKKDEGELPDGAACCNIQ